QTIQLNGNGIPKSITRSITGVDGNAALNISVPYKTSYTQNILSVESSINIKGGTSNTSIGGAGVYGENFTLNNNGSVWGGDGYNGGEELSSGLVRRFQQKWNYSGQVKLTNFYGPTEATIYVNAFDILPNRNKFLIRL
ncbi:hypothetical protein ACT4US_35690, partial [Bacillus sp. HC-Mk]